MNNEIRGRIRRARGRTGRDFRNGRLKKEMEVVKLRVKQMGKGWFLILLRAVRLM